MIEIKTESIEFNEPMENYNKLSKISSFDIHGSNGKITATKNMSNHIKLEKNSELSNLGIKSMF